MTKKISELYHETKAQADRCKPKSGRKAKLEAKLGDLLLRQLRIESPRKRRAA